MADWDVIVIGSGIGGLGGAVALSNHGLKVLVLEQHYLPGGWCHTFALDGHKFSPGVHYVGQLQEGGHFREIIEGLGLGDEIEFLELNPDGYDHIVFNDETFDIPCGVEKFQQRLIERFSDEHVGIKRYFRLMKKVNAGFQYLTESNSLWSKLMVLLRAPAFVLSGLQPLEKIVDKHVKDPKLKAILESRAGDHGASPKDVPFLLHVAVDCHYWDGAWYPKGGGGAFPRAFIKRLKETGSQIRLRTKVDEILVEGVGANKKAVGVRLSDGEEIRANSVLSNADVWMTYTQLLDQQHLSQAMQAKVTQLKPSISALSLFMVADIDPDALGLDSGNYWILHDPNVSATYRQAEQTDLNADGPFAGGFLTITTKKDPSKKHDGLHTLEAFTFVSHAAFQKWQDSNFCDRPQEYEDFKKHLTDRMLETIELVIPNLRDHLKVCELGTPLTNTYYVSAYLGNLYGQEKTLSQIGHGAPPIQTEINGLFHCGQSTAAHGVLGSLSTGITSASKITGKSVDELLTSHVGARIKCHSATDQAEAL